jgi:methionine-gamma-lyase
MRSRFKKDGSPYQPETLALGLGYDAFLSEGAIKPPVFMTSTFKFKSAEEGKHFFDLVYGNVEAQEGEFPGLVYSRLNNPNLEICEERIAAWDNSEKAAVFSSGMSSISTMALTFLKPGDHIISTMPVYGGTFFLFEHVLPQYGIHIDFVLGGDTADQIIKDKVKEVGVDKVKMIYLETPANPSNLSTDIAAVVDIVKDINQSRDEDTRALCVVDNTFLGPLFQRPSEQGADLNIYSATKFIGGHSDLVAGVVTGKGDLVSKVIQMRTILGTQASAHDGWLMSRSLETLSIRMRRQAKNAQKLAEMLNEHPHVNFVSYPGLFEEGSKQKEIHDKQTYGYGSLIAFDVKGGQEGAFKVLNSFDVFGLAVSLGGTESLVQHPGSMTHADIPKEKQDEIGITPGMIRVSVGIEHIDDLIYDMKQALDKLN